MNIAFTTFACPKWSLKQIINFAGSAGYQGVEFRTDAQHGHGIESWISEKERNIFRAQLDRADLKVACIASSIQFTQDGVVEQAVERVKLAGDMGAKGARFFCGPFPEGAYRLEDVLATVTRQLREVCEAAVLFNTSVFLETHDTVATASEMMKVLKAVDHPLLSVCYNNLHPIRAGEPLEVTLSLLKGRIGHVHFHDGMKRSDQVVIRPMGRGEMPMEETLRGLVKTGYDGYLSGEWFYNQYGDEPKDAIELYAAEMRILAERNSIAFGRS